MVIISSNSYCGQSGFQNIIVELVAAPRSNSPTEGLRCLDQFAPSNDQSGPAKDQFLCSYVHFNQMFWETYPLLYLHRGEMARPFHQDPQLFEGKRQGFTEQVDAGKIIPS